MQARGDTDGLKSFTGLQEAGFKHVPRSQPLRIDLRKGAALLVVSTMEPRAVLRYQNRKLFKAVRLLSTFSFRENSADAR